MEIKSETQRTISALKALLEHFICLVGILTNNVAIFWPKFCNVLAPCFYVTFLIFLKGMLGFEKQINRLMDLTAYQVMKMKEMGDKFYLLNEEPECTNVIFWYVPNRLRSRNFPQAFTRDWHMELGKVRAQDSCENQYTNIQLNICLTRTARSAHR